MKKIALIFSLIIFLGMAFSVHADSVSEKRTFYVDSSYDLNSRDEIEAVLIKVTSKLYFYVDTNWWSSAPQNKVYEYFSCPALTGCHTPGENGECGTADRAQDDDKPVRQPGMTVIAYMIKQHEQAGQQLQHVQNILPKI